MGFDNSHNNNGTSNSNDFNNNKIMLSAIFALAFVILLVIILHLYARCALRPPRRHFGVPTASFIYSHQVRHVEPVPPKTGLDQDAINTLPSFLYKELHGRDNEECAVCLSMLENQELARRLPNCNHIFHLECIDTWLTGQPTCPICRSDATPRLSPLDREPPRGSARIEIAVATSGGDQHEHDQQGQGLVHNNNSSSNKGIHINGIGPSTSSSSFRLSSFRRIIGLERSSSSRRIQVNNAELDLERQGQ